MRAVFCLEIAGTCFADPFVETSVAICGLFSVIAMDIWLLKFIHGLYIQGFHTWKGGADHGIMICVGAANLELSIGSHVCGGSQGDGNFLLLLSEDLKQVISLFLPSLYEFNFLPAGWNLVGGAADPAMKIGLKP